jgi:hypothetical protein
MCKVVAKILQQKGRVSLSIPAEATLLEDIQQRLDQRRLKQDFLVFQDVRGLESLPGPGVTS